jgi:hypothetical protein
MQLFAAAGGRESWAMGFLRSELSNEIWDLVATFLEAKSLFQDTYNSYETKVLTYAAARGVDRRFLRLNAEEVSGLLDFEKLGSLRNEQLQALKHISHNLFRKPGQTDKFDRYMSEIYHELSILKEEQYKVTTFAPQYNPLEEQEEYEMMLDEVHEAFPRKVHNIYDLFQKAQKRLEQLLPDYGRDKVLIRSLYLFGEELVEDSYPGGLPQFYEVIYPGGAPEGYLEVARSFLGSGFREIGEECLKQVLVAIREYPPDDPRLSERFEREASNLLRRLETETPVDAV